MGAAVRGGESAYFLAVNRGKRSVELDLARPEAQETLLRLARRSDVVVENFRRGGAERLGAGYERLAAANPRLVYCSIVGFGDDRPGYDFVVQAESGLMAITGEEGGQPVKVGVAVVDVLAGYAAATSILGALLERRGGRIEISLYDVAVSALVNVAQGALVTDTEPERHGNAHPSIVPYQTFHAADELVAVAAANDGLFRRLCKALERPELAADERFATNPARVRHRAGLTAELDTVFATRSAAVWVNGSARPGSRSAACEACSKRSRVRRSRSTTRRLGALPLVRSPLGASLRPPPLLGEHTREVLDELES